MCFTFAPHSPADCEPHGASAANLGGADNTTTSFIVTKGSFTPMLTAVDSLAKHVRGEVNLSEQVLTDLRDVIVNNLSYGGAGFHMPLVALGYETIQSYESIHGPLFTDEGTKTFRGTNSLTDGHALERAMQAVYLIVFDGVNAANLATDPNLIGAMVFRSHEYFPGSVPKPANPNAVYQMRIDASVPEDWGRRTYTHYCTHVDQQAPMLRPVLWLK